MNGSVWYSCAVKWYSFSSSGNRSESKVSFQLEFSFCISPSGRIKLSFPLVLYSLFPTFNRASSGSSVSPVPVSTKANVFSFCAISSRGSSALQVIITVGSSVLQVTVTFGVSSLSSLSLISRSYVFPGTTCTSSSIWQTFTSSELSDAMKPS